MNEPTRMPTLPEFVSQTARSNSGPSKVYRFIRKWPLIPGAIIVTLLVAGIFAPWIAPDSPTAAVLRDRNTPPMWMAGGSSDHILGADQQGRDILSRVIHGARITLIIAGAALIIGGTVGVTLGMISGYYGGIVDEIIMRIIDVKLAIPLILVALVVVITIGQSFPILVGILAVNAWSGFARQVRAETLKVKELDYIAFARIVNASDRRILIKHIFPGVVSTVIVIATLQVGGLILTEAILSFLGAGVPPPTPAWGSMVSEGRQYLGTAWWVSVFPGLAIFLTVLAFNFIGDWIRDRLDPRLRQLE
jgi:peptide/nickel transport system permease protein